METQQNLVHKPKMSPGYFFLSLGLLITLITSVVSFLNLVFETLNKRYPDVLNANYTYGYSTYEYENIRMALATLIIFFPVFMVVSYFWKKYSESIMGAIDMVLHKWVMYIILFLSSLVIVIDLVALVRYFVSGEITNRFILKVVSAFIVALLVGGYYMLLLRKKDSTYKAGIVFSSVGVALVIGAIVYSFMIMGSPSEQRKYRLDDRRVNDLQGIQWQVINFWQQKEKLPEKLEDLANPLTGYSLPVEPEFEKGNVYEYKKLTEKGSMTFELCATFSLPMPKGWQEYSSVGVMPMMPVSEKGVATDVTYPYPGPGGMNESWDHQSGHTCFERTIDPDIYPTYKAQGIK